MNKKKWMAGLLCTALLLFSGCGAANQGEEAPLQEITLGEVTHSILTQPKR